MQSREAYILSVANDSGLQALQAQIKLDIMNIAAFPPAALAVAGGG